MAAKILHEKIVMEGDWTPSAFAVTRRVILWLADIVVVLLLLRFVFRAFGANPATVFTKIIYGLSSPLIAPFAGVFSPSALEGFVVEWSTIVAAVVYIIVTHFAIRLLRTIGAPAKPAPGGGGPDTG